MANGILSILRGMVGSSDGTTTGTPSVQKVVSGVASVVSTTSDALLTTIDAVLDNILGQLDVKLSTRATEVTVATLATEATAATLASEATAATLATEATAVTLGTEVTLAAVQTAAELIDDAVVAQDGAAGKAMTAGVELADIAALPADGVAGAIRRLLGSLKGILYTYEAYLGFAEDASRNVIRVEEQPSYSAETGIDLAIVAAGNSGRLYGLLYSVTVAAQVILRNDGVVGGSIIKTFDLPVGCNFIPLKGMTYGNGVFLDVVGGTGTYVVLYRDT